MHGSAVADRRFGADSALTAHGVPGRAGDCGASGSRTGSTLPSVRAAGERTTLAGAGFVRAAPLLRAPRTPDATTTGSVHDQ